MAEAAEYCLCRGPDTGEFTICCDGCDEWYHGTCVSLTRAESTQLAKWYCTGCAKKGMKVVLKPVVHPWRQQQSNMPEVGLQHGQPDAEQYDVFVDTSSKSAPPPDRSIVDVIIDYLPKRPWTKPRVKRWWEEFNLLELDGDLRSAVIMQTWEIKLEPQFPGDIRLSERDVEHALLAVANRLYARVTKAKILRWMLVTKVPTDFGKRWIMEEEAVPKLNDRSKIPTEVLMDEDEPIFVDQEAEMEVDDELPDDELDEGKLSVLQKLLQARSQEWTPVADTEFGKYLRASENL